MKRYSILLLIIVSLLFAACGGDPNPPVSVEVEGEQIVTQSRIHLTIEVGGDPNSLVYQQRAASGSYVGINGYSSGSFTGQVIDGKGIVRVRIISIDEHYPGIDRNDNFIIKFEDGKSVALLQGDVLSVNCVVDVEFVGIHTGDAWDRGTDEDTRERVIEIDDCRWSGELLNVAATPVFEE